MIPEQNLAPCIHYRPLGPRKADAMHQETSSSPQRRVSIDGVMVCGWVAPPDTHKATSMTYRWAQTRNQSPGVLEV